MLKFYLVLLFINLSFAQITTGKFENGLIPSDWTEISGSSDFAYTPSLEGNYSLQIASDGLIQIDFTAEPEIWMFFKIKLNYPTGSVGFIGITNSGAIQADLYAYTTNKFRFLGYTGNPSGTFVLSQGIELGVLVHYVKGTGANAVAQLWTDNFNADGTWIKPASADIDRSDGTGILDINRILLRGSVASGGLNIWDDVVISSTELGDYTPPVGGDGLFEKYPIFEKH